MKENKFTEIRNRTAYIHNLLDELEVVIKEAELTDDINTKREAGEEIRMVDATVNDLEEYELDDERCKAVCTTRTGFMIGVVVVMIIYCVISF